MKSRDALEAMEFNHENTPPVTEQGNAPVKPMLHTGRITPTQHEKNEWSRMATNAYARDLNDIGHKFSKAATLRNGDSCATAWFDALQAEYRAWLIGGFKVMA